MSAFQTPPGQENRFRHLASGFKTQKKPNVLVAPSVCAGMDERPVTTPAACPHVSGQRGLHGRRVESPVVWGCNSATGAA